MTPPYLGQSSGPFSRFIEGEIAGDGDIVALYCPNSSGVTIDIEGTFTGRITATGGEGVGALEGGRLLFQSGVGSTGINFVDGIGDARRTEYRAIAGGDFFILRGSNWSSGSARVRVTAQEAPTTLFVNGPVRTSFEEAVRAARAFVASTGPQNVQSGNAIILTFANPADSGVNVHLVNRLFGNNLGPTATNLEYVAYASPSYAPTNPQSGINLRGATPFSVAQFRWQVRSLVGLVVGGTEGSGEILPNGETYSRPLEVMLLPGRSVGFLITGAGNNLANAARVSMTLEWYEEGI